MVDAVRRENEGMADEADLPDYAELYPEIVAEGPVRGASARA